MMDTGAIAASAVAATPGLPAVQPGPIGVPLLIVVGVVYLGLLFAIAWWADRRAASGHSVSANPTIYALSLAVYCTAWTFYGSVGRAAADGLGFLPIYLGPTLIVLLWGSLLVKMVRVSKAQRITSIADFIASRYGKSQALGGLVTVIAVVGVVPYISLQLKAIADTFTLLSGYPAVAMPTGPHPVLWADTALLAALLLAAFTILFGTRHLDASERHEGMVTAVAFESIVKLVAFMAVGLFVTFGLLGLNGAWFGPTLPALADNPRALALLEPALLPVEDWVAISLLSAAAVMLLPRQFQVGVVEANDEGQIRRAIWLFPLYLLLINLFVVPIALAGLLTFPNGSVTADTFVLTVPMAHGAPWLALVVFIGGLSAATGMVIVETIALSTMVSNDLILPLVLRWLHRRGRRSAPGEVAATAPAAAPTEAAATAPNASPYEQASEWHLGELLLLIRRAAIVVILLLGYGYYRVASEEYALISIGLISFAAIAQFAPAVLGALYWRGGTRNGAAAGLIAGFTVWVYTLLLPSFAKSGWLPNEFEVSGIFGIELLRAQALFGLTGLNEITHSLLWSLTANIGAFVLVSSLRAPNAVEAAQASAFVDAPRRPGRVGVPLWRGSVEVAELRKLAERFLGRSRTERAFGAFARERGVVGSDALPADARTVEFAENLLSGAIGGASARVMVAQVTREEAMGLEEVLHILDEASQLRAYSRELEQKSRALELASAELRAANQRLTELDRLKDDFMSSVTHELRTPLAAIRAFSEILRDDPEIDLAERKRFLGILVSETERLSRLVNQVLDLAKIESGHADWQSEAVDLNAAVEQAVASSGQLLERRGTRLALDLPAIPVMVLGDRDRLIQVMVNLLSNAGKFTPEGAGLIRVALTTTDGRATVVVNDNGPGIPASDLDSVFERFRQSKHGSEKPIGTGLGLPICRRIIEHLGGRIWAEPPGAGNAGNSDDLETGPIGTLGDKLADASPATGATLCFELPLTNEH